MKRIIVFLTLVIPAGLLAQTSIYSLSFTNSDSQSVQLSDFAGKKVLVVAFNAADPDWQQLRSLDTLYQNRMDSFAVIAIPVTDCGGENDEPLTDQQLRTLFNDEYHLGYTLAAQGKGKRDAGGQQHPVLDWVTHVGSNTHFDRDVEAPGQMFILNESGRLYAVVGPKITATGLLMNEIINKQFEN